MIIYLYIYFFLIHTNIFIYLRKIERQENVLNSPKCNFCFIQLYYLKASNMFTYSLYHSILNIYLYTSFIILDFKKFQ